MACQPDWAVHDAMEMRNTDTARMERPPSGRTRAVLISLVSNYIGSGVAIVKGVVLVPLYVHTLGVDVYGAFLASANIVGILGVVDFGVSSVLCQRMAVAWGARDSASFVRLAAAGLLVVPCLLALLVGTGLAVAPYVPEWIRAPAAAHHSITRAFALSVIGAAGNLATMNLSAVASAWQKTGIAAAARIGAQLVETIAIVVALAMGLGVVGLGLGALVGAWLGFLICAIWTIVAWARMRIPRPHWSRTATIDLAWTVAPTMLSRTLLQIGTNLEVALVSRLIGPAEAAIYSISERIYRLALNFVTPIAGSTLSSLAHFVGERGVRAAKDPTRELLLVWSLIVATIFPTLVALNQDFSTLWVGQRNYGGAALNVLLCAAAILGSRDYLLHTALISIGKISVSAWVISIESLVRIPLMYAGILLGGISALPLVAGAVSLTAIVALGSFVNRGLALVGREAWQYQFGGALSVCVMYLVAVAELAALPRVGTWGGLTLKGTLISCAHIALSMLLNPQGRAALFKRFPRLQRRTRVATGR